jgi:peptidoglycan/xylan/chitin deacetylase (PgdA/CDA1 family)
VATNLYCKILNLKLNTPIISFSFDDAPQTAFIHGAEILSTYGAKGTFYVSFGMLGLDSPSGKIASLADLHNAIKDEHELGCHTYDHKNSWESRTNFFLRSVLRNRRALSKNIPGAVFSSFAYPICGPKPSTKRMVSKLFECSRGGKHTLNEGKIDLNLLNAYFLDVRIGDTIDKIKTIIDKNIEKKGWLIFATHDIGDKPSIYGCTKKFLNEVVKYSENSGALLLPVGKAYSQINKICTVRLGHD